MKTRKPLIFHPILFGLYPVVALFAHNISQLSTWMVFRPALALLAASIFLVGLAQLLFKNWLKSGLLVSWFLILWFSYGQVFTLTRNFSVLGLRLGRDIVFAVVWVVLFIGGWWIIAKIVKTGDVLTQYLNVAGVIAILLPILQVGLFAVNHPTASPKNAPATGSTNRPALQVDTLAVPAGKTTPDVYYIILDAYARADILSKNLNFDNSAFINDLKGMGFYVATCGQSNYGSTVLSLTSSLNMDYLDKISPELVKSGTDAYALNPLLLHNRVVQDFKTLGYETVAFQSGFSPTEWLDSDIYIQQKTSFFQQAFGFPGLNPFEGILFNTTPGLLYLDLRIKLSLPRPTWFDSAYVQYRDRILYELDQLGTVPAIPGHKFVFVHILAPHTPIVFGPHGEAVQRDTAFTLNYDVEYDSWQKYSEEYGGELIYLNQRVEEFVRKILAESPTPPIIIIQGDHGIPKGPDLLSQMANLNAYYLPDTGEKLLYPTITPVNSFRIVFDQYFNGQFPLLKDASYQSSVFSPFKFKNATNQSNCATP